MKLGIQVNHFTWEGGDAIIGPTYGSIGRKAEEADFDSFWVMDHFFQIPGLGQVEEPMLERYSALAFIAGQTQKIKLGTMVTGVTYRHPGILVKTVTTLAVLSGGRAWLGEAGIETVAARAGYGMPSRRARDAIHAPAWRRHFGVEGQIAIRRALDLQRRPADQIVGGGGIDHALAPVHPVLAINFCGRYFSIFINRNNGS